MKRNQKQQQLQPQQQQTIKSHFYNIVIRNRTSIY